MKRLLPFFPLLLLAALLLSPAAALAGAKRGLELWWGQVLPALLPSFICVKLSQELGLLRIFRHRSQGQIMLVLGFSLVSGAPNGAKLLHALAQEGELSRTEGDRLLPLVNSVSPAFLVSIIASDPLKNKALLPPALGAFYGCILCLLLPNMLSKRAVSPSECRGSQESVPFSTALTSAIESSMLDMLRIGGCVLFACTLLALLQPVLPSHAVYAVLAGAMEVSTGAAAIAGLSLPLRLKTSLLIGTAAFGGMSVSLQTMCCRPGTKPLPYLRQKLLLGAVVGLVCYLLFPLFPRVSTVFASRQEVMSRSLSLCALLLSSVLSAAFVGVLSLMVGQSHSK